MVNSLSARRRRARRLAQQGMALLREAVDLVLEEHEESVLGNRVGGAQGLGASEITKRTDLYPGPKTGRMNDGMATAVLYDLLERGRVKREKQGEGRTKGRAGWRMK